MLRESIIELCVERGDGPATRLGRFRKRQEARKKRKEKGEAAKEATEIKTIDDSRPEEPEIVDPQGDVMEETP